MFVIEVVMVVMAGVVGALVGSVGSVIRMVAQCVPGTSGRPNQVVLSTGLIDALTPAQVELVCAHEESHLRSGHRLHLVLARAVEASCWFWPPARSSVGVLRLSLERSADEVAAGPTPEARKQLATALLAVAIEGPTTALAFSALDGLMERVTAMGDPEWMVLSARWAPGHLHSGTAARSAGPPRRRSTRTQRVLPGDHGPALSPYVAASAPPTVVRLGMPLPELLH